MDGTLTLAIHDFDQIRTQLGLPVGEPILEAIARLPADKARATHQRLDEIEFEIADQATPQPGARELLDELSAKGHNIGCLLYTSPSPRDATLSRMPSSA